MLKPHSEITFLEKEKLIPKDYFIECHLELRNVSISLILEAFALGNV